MYEKEKEEKSNNVGVTIDITKVAEIHCHRQNSSLYCPTCLCVYLGLSSNCRKCASSY